MNQIDQTSAISRRSFLRRAILPALLPAGVAAVGISKAHSISKGSNHRAELLAQPDYTPVFESTSAERIAAMREELASLNDAEEFIREFGRPLKNIPIRDALLQHHNRAGWNGEYRDRVFRREFGSENTLMYPLMDFDSSWMPKLMCNNYTWHHLRREPEEFNVERLVGSPSSNTDSSYLPVKEPQDFDVVCYFAKFRMVMNYETSRFWMCPHIGMWYAGKVISKNNTGNVYHHVLDAVPNSEDPDEQQIAIFLRKVGEEDPRDKPLLTVSGYDDWVYQDGAVARNSFWRSPLGKVSAWGSALLAIGAAEGVNRIVFKKPEKEEQSADSASDLVI